MAVPQRAHFGGGGCLDSGGIAMEACVTNSTQGCSPDSDLGTGAIHYFFSGDADDVERLSVFVSNF
ncbi:MAG: hypothetical protein JWR80_7750 [Bradyrhizobium sp.]|nr:hypothetical protein [Bradyrhizobium sp.]